jgi:hypothetical protein
MENFIIEDTALTSEECDKIVAFIKDNEDKFVDRGYNNLNSVMARTIVLSALIDTEIPGAKEIDDLIYTNVNKFLSETVFPYFRNNNSDIPLSNLHDSGYELREIVGTTHLHQDGVMPKHDDKYTQLTYRVGTLVLSLYDSKDTLAFPNQQKEFKLTKGKILFFPPFWTHPHFTNYGGEKTYRVQSWLYASDVQ